MQRKKKKITSMDIAKAAGVSQSTVSMILNGKKISSFTDDTVRRVMEAANELGYEYGRGAKREAGNEGDSKLVMVVCPVISNPYYSAVVQAIEQRAHEFGLRTVICTTYRSMDVELRHLAYAEKSGLAGIIFTAVPLHVKMVEGISKRVPVVVIADRDDLISVDTVEVNSYQCGIAIAEYLMELGHRRVGFLSSTLNNQNRIRLKRMEGIRDALEKSGKECRFVVKSQDILTVEENADPQIEYKIGWRLAMECVEQEDVTALVALNDMVAYGALDALKSAGKQVPGDYSVCGFDNIFPSQLNGIQLSSIENFMVEKGRNAMDMLLKRMQLREDGAEEVNGSITRVEYQPRLIIRETTGRAPER